MDCIPYTHEEIAKLEAQVASLTRERDAAQAQNRITLGTWEKALVSFNRTMEKLTRERDSLREALLAQVNHGDDCFCVDRAQSDDGHSSYCVQARAALATPEENQDAR